MATVLKVNDYAGSTYPNRHFYLSRREMQLHAKLQRGKAAKKYTVHVAGQSSQLAAFLLFLSPDSYERVLFKITGKTDFESFFAIMDQHERRIGGDGTEIIGKHT